MDSKHGDELDHDYERDIRNRFGNGELRRGCEHDPVVALGIVDHRRASVDGVAGRGERAGCAEQPAGGDELNESSGLTLRVAASSATLRAPR